VAAELDVARFQRHAAERILDDEAWRDGLEDQVSQALLDGILGLVDAAIASAALSIADRSIGDQAAATDLLDDLAYAVADQARVLLDAVARYWRGDSVDDVLLVAEPTLGSPLFTSPDVGRERLTALIRAANSPPDREEASPSDRETNVAFGSVIEPDESPRPRTETEPSPPQVPQPPAQERPA
jgi:hypothetical protein